MGYNPKKHFQLVQDFFHRYSQPSPRMWHCSGATPLMHAIVAGSFEQAAVLIAYGASLEAKNYRGCTVPRRSTGVENGWEQDGNVEIWQKHAKKLRKTCEFCEFQEENVRLIVGFQWETCTVANSTRKSVVRTFSG